LLPEDLLLNLLDHKFDDEQTFEKDDEQFDPIKTLSVHGLRTLHNHFSKVTAATSVNDVITVNVMNMDLQKWSTMAQNKDITVNDMIDTLSGKRPDIWKGELKDWLIWILHSPNQNTELTNRNILRHSETIQRLNGKQAGQSLFLSGQPSHYTKGNTDNQDRILLPGETIIKTVDKKLYRPIGEENNRELLVQNAFNAPKKGIRHGKKRPIFCSMS
jgi:hypothetical protein